MPSTDDRIVSMKFDNRAFEQQVDSTIKGLERLKSSLNFKNIKTSFNDLRGIDKTFNFEHLSTAVDKVAEKFNVLNAVAFATISNITNKALNAGQSLVKSLSLDQTIAGFREYEMNIGSIQTILANTSSQGTTLEQVQTALDQLNEYSDKTIYNFGQMVKNIGTFSAAGVDLDTSVNAIKGFSNVAAISGANAEQASLGMYQLSQALAAGQVRLMDWKSMETAGIGGALFQKSLFETAKALGTLKNVSVDTTFEQWEKSAGKFRTTLDDGWLTAEVMTTTLNAFTGDLNAAQIEALGYTKEQAIEMERLGRLGEDAATKVKTLTQLVNTIRENVASGWSASFRVMFGNFEQAKETFSMWYGQLGAIVNRNADARNKILGDWAKLGGREDLIAGITVAFYALFKALKPIKDAFREIFPRKTGAELFALTRRFVEFTQKLIISEGTADKLKSIFKGLFSIFKIFTTVVKGVIGVFKTALSVFASVGGSPILSFLAGLGDSVTTLSKKLTNGGGIANYFNKINNAIAKFGTTFKIAMGFFQKGISGEFVQFNNKASSVYKIAYTLGQVFAKMGEVFVSVGSGIKSVVVGIGGFFYDTFVKIKDVLFGVSDAGNSVKETIGKDEGGPLAKGLGGFAKVADTVVSILNGLIDILGSIGSVAEKFGSVIGEVFNGIWEGLGNFGDSKAYDGIIKALKIGFFATIIGLFRNFSKGGLLGLFGGKSFSKEVNKLVESVTDTFERFQTVLKAQAIKEIAIAIGILAVSLAILSFLNAGDIAGGLVSLSVGLVSLTTALVGLNKIKTGGANNSAGQLVLMSGSLILLSAALIPFAYALRVLSTLNAEQIYHGMAATTVILLAMGLAIKDMSEKAQPKHVLGAAFVLLGLAHAIQKFADVVLLLGDTPWQVLVQGGISLGVMLSMLVAAINMLPDSGDTEKKLGGILLFSIGLRVMADAIKVLGNMDPDALERGMKAFLAIMAALTLAIMGLDKIKRGLTDIAPLILSLAAAMAIFTAAIVILSFLSWESLGKGIGTLVVGMALLVGAVRLLDGKEANAKALLMLSGGIVALSIALSTLGQLTLGQIVLGLVGLGAALAIIVAAGYAAGYAAPGLEALGTAILMLGGGFALIGLGVYLISEAMASFSKYGEQSIAVFKKFLAAGISLVPDLVMSFVGGLADGFIELAGKIAESAPELISKFKGIFIQALKAISEILPELGKTIGDFIDMLIQLFVDKGPDILTAGYEFLLNFLKGLQANASEIAITVAKIVSTFLTSLSTQAMTFAAAGLKVLTSFIQGITENVQPVVDAFTALIVEVLTSMTENVDPIIESGTNFILKWIEGITKASNQITQAGAKAIVKFMEGISSAILVVINGAADVIVQFLEGLATSIETNRYRIEGAGMKVIAAIFSGITSRIKGVITWFKNLPTNIATWVVNKIKDLGPVGKAVIEGIWEGISSMTKWIQNKIKSMLDWLPGWVKDILGIRSPSKVFAEIGKFVGLGLAVGIADPKSKKTIENSMTNLSNSVTDSFAPNESIMQNNLSNIVARMSQQIENIDSFNPTITPVLDLTNVQKDAGRINSFLRTSPITADISTQQASVLVEATQMQNNDQVASSGPSTTEIKFEQNVYSPTALSVVDIYRQTRSQITLAKEELSIL